MLTTDLRPNYDAELRRDADARGLELLARHELSFGQASLGNRVGRFAQLAVLGETTARYTDAVLYHLARAGSPLLYVQPFERSIALPGFLHVCLDGSFEVPVTIRRKLFRLVWHAADSGAVARHLEASPPLKAAVKELSWTKHNQVGKSELEWVVQVRALGNGASEVIFQLGSPALSLCASSLRTCLDVCDELAPLLATSPAPAGEGPEELQGGYWVAPFSDAFFELLNDPS